MTGTGLADAGEPAGVVKFGAASATDVDVNPAGTELTAVAPAGGAGPVHVTVTTIGGTSATSADDEYTYVSPSALTVVKAGTGSGSVECDGGPCEATYPYGSSVTLRATATAGSTFGGWSGACTGVGECVVTVDADTAVTATFTANPPSPPLLLPSPPTTSNLFGKVRLVGDDAKVSDGRAAVRLSCDGPGACAGLLRLTMKVRKDGKTQGLSVGSVRFALVEGEAKTVKVGLSAGARKRLAKGRLRVRVTGPSLSTRLTLRPQK